MDITVVPLHDHPQYTKACCDLINSEWKRSESARLQSLNASCDNLPTSLILLKDNQVIGHAKLSKLPSMPEACFVESVVIDKSVRSHGYGKILMLKLEEYCQDFLKLKTVYLTTKDQEGFYSKLGYEECKPVTIYGSFVPKTDVNSEKTEIHKEDSVVVKVFRNMSLKTGDNESKISPPLPPPFPPPSINNKNLNGVVKTFMKKDL